MLTITVPVTTPDGHEKKVQIKAGNSKEFAEVFAALQGGQMGGAADGGDTALVYRLLDDLHRSNDEGKVLPRREDRGDGLPLPRERPAKPGLVKIVDPHAVVDYLSAPVDFSNVRGKKPRHYRVPVEEYVLLRRHLALALPEIEKAMPHPPAFWTQDKEQEQKRYQRRRVREAEQKATA